MIDRETKEENTGIREQETETCVGIKERKLKRQVEGVEAETRRKKGRKKKEIWRRRRER